MSRSVQLCDPVYMCLAYYFVCFAIHIDFRCVIICSQTLDTEQHMMQCV